ncbi:MAG TPA: hypothetical protein EYP36_06915 [Calditrichaeota bacterium]|nr:hypothetical protein [Calditrichota bacterium]
MKSVSFILLSVMFALACSPSQKTMRQEGEKPEWIDNPYKLFPKSMYLVGVGTGDTREAAENNAFGSIAKIFRSKIQVQQSVYEQFLETNEQFSSTSQLKRRTTVGADEELKNIRTEHTYFSPNEGLYYALAVLDRSETEAMYENELQDNDQKIGEFYELYKKSNNKIHMYTYLAKALALDEQNRAIEQKLDIIAVQKFQREPAVSSRTLHEAMRSLLDRITVRLQAEEGTPEELQDYMREMIGKLGFKMVDGSADFTFNYSLSLKEANLQRDDATGFNWKLTVVIKDNIKGYTLKAFNVEKRTLGISEEQARAKVLRSVRKECTENLYKQFVAYLTSV